jgi:hypothetical protein
MGGGEDAIKQRGFTRAQKTGENGYWNNVLHTV